MKFAMHEYVVNRLLASRGTWPQIAKETGESVRTIQKIASGEIADPGVSHIEKLLDYFTREGYPPPPDARANVDD